MSRVTTSWFLALLLLPLVSFADALDLNFTLHEMGSGNGRTLLVIGGIQGDEPGGFNAASLLVTDYEISAGSVWVVPNLNFESIVRRSRGVYGDMNRKFHHVETTDPEYQAIQDIKRIILDREVDMVLNLHDGSGFYRPKHVDSERGPRRWGQCIVIDQVAIGYGGMAALGTVAERVAGQVNAGIENAEHHYRIKNTHTRDGNEEMAKTLTYFAIENGKPAVGVEASKTLPTHQRVHYHLSIIEAYMRELGIEHKRTFALTPEAVRLEIDSNVQLALYDRFYLDMANARNRMRFVPMKKNEPLQFTASNPLVAVIGDGDDDLFRVSYGNRRVAQLYPEYLDFDDSIEALDMLVDGVAVRAPVGSVVEAVDSFRAQAPDDYRINAIGFKRSGLRNENDVDIRRGDFMERYSVDRDARLFRVEIYRGKRFSGMVLVRFVERRPPPRELISGPVHGIATGG